MSFATIAKQIKGLTYSEMMDMAEWFATTMTGRNNDGIGWDEESSTDWAELLNFWADITLESEGPTQDKESV